MQRHHQALLVLGAASLVGAGLWLALVRQEAPHAQSAAPEGASVAIVLGEDGFAPAEITVRRGDTVTFSTTLGKPMWPASDFHPTHTIFAEFDPKQPVPQTETWSFTFQKAGSWRFHDHLNPQYHGVIHVEK